MQQHGNDGHYGDGDDIGLNTDDPSNNEADSLNFSTCIPQADVRRVLAHAQSALRTPLATKRS